MTGFLQRHKLLVITFHIIVTLSCAPGLLKLQNDNSPNIFFSRDAGALATFHQFQSDFGGGQAVRVALSGSGIWTPRGLAWIADLEDHISVLPGVESTYGLARQYRWMLLNWPPRDPVKFRREVMKQGNDMASGLVSANGDVVSMLVVLSDVLPVRERELLQRLEDITANGPPGIKCHLSGLPVLHLAMDRSLLKMASRFLPLLAILAVIGLTVVFRRIRDIAAPLIFVGQLHIILFGIMGYLGVTLNLVNIILAPLLFVISLATSVHILMRFRQLVNNGMPATLAVRTTYRHKTKPVLWTGLTTFVAFGSLVTASVPPVRTLGLWCAVGIALMTLLTFTSYPLLIASQPKQIKQNQKKHKLSVGTRWDITAFFNKWAPPAASTGGKIKRLAVVCLLLAVVGIPGIRIEDNLGKYFPADHPVRAELEELQASGVGVFAAELIIDNAEEGLRHPSALKRLAGLSASLRSQHLIYGAIGPGDMLEVTLKSLLMEGEVNQQTRWLALGMIQTGEDSRKLLGTLLAEDGSKARITLLLPMLSFHEIQPLFSQVEEIANRAFPGSGIIITGQYPLIIRAQETLLKGLIYSLSLTLLCIAIIFLLLLRSLRLTLKVLLPNVWPVTLVFGGMGWLDIPLDSASVMTASIVLGLAVDDTFHILGYYLRLIKSKSPGTAINATINRSAPALILTSLILAAGFGACALSQLLPVARMGAISAVAILLALFADLFIIPVLFKKNPA